MEQKVVKVEIGKVFAVVIAIVAVALIAAFFIQSSYFQGTADRPVISVQDDMRALTDVRTAIATGNELQVFQAIDNMTKANVMPYSLGDNMKRVYSLGDRGKQKLLQTFAVVKRITPASMRDLDSTLAVYK
jgi:hypothetical protein